MIFTRGRVSMLGGLALLCAAMIATPSYADQISWADWSPSTLTLASGATPGNADGTFDGGITVNFQGDVALPTQVGAGTDTDYWSGFSSIHKSPPTVDNAPPPSDVIALIGGESRVVTQTLLFSEPVLNPVMAILSMGQLTVRLDYIFDHPFEILNQGQGFFGAPGNSLIGNLTPTTGTNLTGFEGHGIIRFTSDAPISSISWTVPNPEDWNGFTIGVRSVPEPASLILLGAGLAGIGIWRRKAAKIG